MKELNDILNDIEKISENTKVLKGSWNLYKILVHCSQTIEYSIIGYPKMKPSLIRVTIGRVVIKKILKDGQMKHDLEMPVPGSIEIENLDDTKKGREILINSINKFMNYNGELKEHLIFGKLSKEEYAKYFAIHIKNHLEAIGV